MTPLLDLDDVGVAYRGIPAVTGVSLCVPAGRIVTVIGPNGAGKSTLLNAVMGVLPARGRIASPDATSAAPAWRRACRPACRWWRKSASCSPP